MDFVSSYTNHGRNKILFQGYAYVKKYDLTDDWECFECERRRNFDGCPGKVKVRGEEIVILKDHLHQEEPAFSDDVGKIAALAFVPENDVERYFRILSENIDEDLDTVIDYIEENYLGVIRRGRFRRARFSYSWWGVLDRVYENLPRTNNSVEGWHSSFNRHVGCHHANIWKLIAVLKNDDDITCITLVKILQGNPPKNPNPVYSRLNARVVTVVNSYDNRTPMEFLRAIAHNLKI